ncbi:Protein fmp32, mitochondrial [Cryomyces antarcticus]|nr:Protein fmp32, mitochondrial [Cryomyces antarcticus]
MATSTLQAAVPRFLPPRLTWTAPATRPAFATALHPDDRPRRYQIRAATSPAGYQTKACSRQDRTPICYARQEQRFLPRSTILAEGRKAFSATARRPRDHHFDTLKFVQRLRDEGFSEEQAVAMMKVLGDVIEESIQNLTRTMVLREEQEKVTYTQKVDFAKLRSEILSSDSAESALTRASHDRLMNDLTKLNSRLRDEIERTRASVRLDLNLEKGRIREEANVQELKLKETETRVEQEAATLRERLEAVKFSTLQWLMGVCTGTAALILGIWRLLM